MVPSQFRRWCTQRRFYRWRTKIYQPWYAFVPGLWKKATSKGLMCHATWLTKLKYGTQSSDIILECLQRPQPMWPLQLQQERSINHFASINSSLRPFPAFIALRSSLRPTLVQFKHDQSCQMTQFLSPTSSSTSVNKFTSSHALTWPVVTITFPQNEALPWWKSSPF